MTLRLVASNENVQGGPDNFDYFEALASYHYVQFTIASAYRDGDPIRALMLAQNVLPKMIEHLKVEREALIAADAQLPAEPGL